jgi:hypothetical protein
MAEVIWAEPALNDLDAIADYIALDNPEAARRLMQKIFEHVGHLESHAKLGSKPPEQDVSETVSTECLPQNNLVTDLAITAVQPEKPQLRRLPADALEHKPH